MRYIGMPLGMWLLYGDDECNFHLMSKARAAELGFVPDPNAK